MPFISFSCLIVLGKTSKTMLNKTGKRRHACLFPDHCCCCSVTKSCPTLCDPMDCSMPGFPVLHYLLELAQTHIHRGLSVLLFFSNQLLFLWFPLLLFYFSIHLSLFQFLQFPSLCLPCVYFTFCSSFFRWEARVLIWDISAF